VTDATQVRLPYAAGGFYPRIYAFGPADRQADGRILETPDFFLEQGIPMKKIVIAAALLMISASAQAGTYSYEGVTVHVQDGCRSSSCVSVVAPTTADIRQKSEKPTRTLRA
jgi:hypothetical protein